MKNKELTLKELQTKVNDLIEKWNNSNDEERKLLVNPDSNICVKLNVFDFLIVNSLSIEILEKETNLENTDDSVENILIVDCSKSYNLYQNYKPKEEK